MTQWINQDGKLTSPSYVIKDKSCQMTVVKLLQTLPRASFIVFTHSFCVDRGHAGCLVDTLMNYLSSLFFSCLPLDYFIVLKHSHRFVVKRYARSV